MSLSAAELLARDKRAQQLAAEPAAPAPCEHADPYGHDDIRWCGKCGALGLAKKEGKSVAISWRLPTG